MATLADDPRPPSFGPTQPGERIETLDILRGFALLGICVINLQGFFMPFFFYAAGEDLYPHRRDQLAMFLVDLFGSGKFNSLFSFLFGLGFAIQLERAEGKGAPFAGIYVRRLLVLLAMGVAHCLLIWNGDVLHIYALIGLPLLFVRKLSDRWLWGIAVLLLVLPMGYETWKFVQKKPREHPPSYYRERAENQLRVFGKGSYDDFVAPFTKTAPTPPRHVEGLGSYPLAVKERFRETREGYLEHGEAWFWPILGTTMVLGFLAGRRRLFQDLDRHLPTIRRAAVWTGIVGFVLAPAFAAFSLLQDHGSETPTVLGLLSGMFYVLNRPVLAAFYVCAIVLLSRRPALRPLFAPLASVGRMPLTNYLMQSVIASFLFYGYGLGYYARVGPAAGVLIAFGIYAVQVVYSNIWMSFFRFGPMEWLWRTLTYGKAPAMVAPKPGAALAAS